SDARTRPDAECRIRHGCRVQPRAATGLGARHGPCLGARMHAPANAGDEALRVGAALRPSFSLGEADVLAFVAIPLVLGALVVGAVAWAAPRLREGERVASRAIGATGLLAGGWLAASWYAARSGALAPLDARERTLAVAALAAAALVLALLGFGRRLAAGLPLTALIGVQAFRWPLAHALDGL